MADKIEGQQGGEPAGQSQAGGKAAGDSILGAGGHAGEGGTPPPGDGQPPAGDGTPPAGEGTPWSWAENIPGSGTPPPWFKADKYKTVDAQARAAVELEKKLGPAADVLGAPEESYALPDTAALEGLDGWQWNAEDPLLQSFQAAAKELGLSQKAHDTIVAHAARVMAEQDRAQQVALSEAITALGNNAPQRINQVRTFLTSKIGEDGFASLQAAIGTDVAAYQALEKVVAMASGDAQLSSGAGLQGPGFTREDIQAEQYKVFPEGHPLTGKRMYEHDKAHREKVDRMWKELFPGENRIEVG